MLQALAETTSGVTAPGEKATFFARKEQPKGTSTSLSSDPVVTVAPRTRFQITRRVEQVKAPQFFVVLQSFDGIVLSVGESSFSAEITDKTKPENPKEIVELPIDDVQIGDMSLIQPGSVFYWVLGYQDNPGTPRRRASQIRFRRLPLWTREELEAAKNFAADYLALLKD